MKGRPIGAFVKKLFQLFKMTRPELSLFAIALSFFFLVAWTSVQYQWPNLLGNYHFDPVFADLRLITLNADCVGEDSWSVGSTECDLWGRAYVYSSNLAVFLNLLGLGYEESGLIGLALTLAFAGSWALLVFSTRGGSLNLNHVVINTAGLMSPPVLLAVERGNSDLLVFFILVFVGVALARSQRAVGGLLLVAAISHKLFPMGAVLAFLLTLKAKRLRWALGVLLAGFLSLLLNFREWVMIVEVADRPGASGGFGASVLLGEGLALLGIDQSLISRALGAGMFLAAIYLAWIFSERRETQRGWRHLEVLTRCLSASPVHRVMFGVGMGALLGAYVLTPSYDYRLALILFPIAAISGAVPSEEPARRISLTILLLVMYLSYPLPYAFQLLGDVLGMFAFCVAGVVLLRTMGSAKAAGNSV